MNVVCIDNKQQWTDQGKLGYARRHWDPTENVIVNDNCLRSIQEIKRELPEQVPPYSHPVQFKQQDIVIDPIEYFPKISLDNIHLLTVIHGTLNKIFE